MEFMAFARRHADFRALNMELPGLSSDSYYSHDAWVRNIKEKRGVTIPSPIIEDLGMKVVRAFRARNSPGKPWLKGGKRF